MNQCCFKWTLCHPCHVMPPMPRQVTKLGVVLTRTQPPYYLCWHLPTKGFRWFELQNLTFKVPRYPAAAVSLFLSETKQPPTHSLSCSHLYSLTLFCLAKTFNRVHLHSIRRRRSKKYPGDLFDEIHNFFDGWARFNEAQNKQNSKKEKLVTLDSLNLDEKEA